MSEELEINLLRQLNGEEARKRYAYLDHLGFLTIGCGRLIDERKGGGLSSQEIDYLLGNDVTMRHSQLLERWPWITELTAPRVACLLQMSFQMGVLGLAGFPNTLRLVQSKAYTEAASAMLDSKWAQQTPERAKRVSEQMRTGLWVFKPGF